jgi:hypothetical protein
MSKEFTVSSVTMGVTLSEKIPDLKYLYEILTVYQVNYTVGTKIEEMKRETVPFFKHNNVIVGLKYLTSARGIVRAKGHFSNLIGVDLQCYNKNINMKLASDNITITGAKSVEMASGAAEILLDFITMVNNHMIHIKSLPSNLIEESLEWIMENITLITYDENYQALYKIKPFYECLEALNNIPTDVDERAIRYLMSFASEFEYLQDYYNKVQLLLSYQPLSSIPTIVDSKIGNIMYNYNIGRKIGIKKTAIALGNLQNSQGESEYMQEKNTLVPSYHNWHSKRQISLAVYIGMVNGKIKSHKFTIYQSGSIRQNSCTSYEEAHKQYLKLMHNIETYVP